MQSKVAPYAAAPDPTYGHHAPAAAPSVAAGPEVQGEDAEADLRLIIEEQDLGSYVYKTVDRRTGEVLRQFPREEVLRMRGEADYHAGGVIRTKA